MAGHFEIPTMMAWRHIGFDWLWIPHRTAYPPLCSAVQLVLPNFSDYVFPLPPLRCGIATRRPSCAFSALARRPLVIRMDFVARTRQDKPTSKRATNKHVERPLIKPLMRGPANSITNSMGGGGRAPQSALPAAQPSLPAPGFARKTTQANPYHTRRNFACPNENWAGGDLSNTNLHTATKKAQPQNGLEISHDAQSLGGRVLQGVLDST